MYVPIGARAGCEPDARHVHVLGVTDFDLAGHDAQGHGLVPLRPCLPGAEAAGGGTTDHHGETERDQTCQHDTVMTMYVLWLILILGPQCRSPV